jgi:hypothetical protein
MMLLKFIHLKILCFNEQNVILANCHLADCLLVKCRGAMAKIKYEMKNER